MAPDQMTDFRQVLSGTAINDSVCSYSVFPPTSYIEPTIPEAAQLI
jgi:hypothetical protein